MLPRKLIEKSLIYETDSSDCKNPMTKTVFEK